MVDNWQDIKDTIIIQDDGQRGSALISRRVWSFLGVKTEERIYQNWGDPHDSYRMIWSLFPYKERRVLLNCGMVDNLLMSKEYAIQKGENQHYRDEVEANCRRKCREAFTEHHKLEYWMVVWTRYKGAQPLYAYRTGEDSDWSSYRWSTVQLGDRFFKRNEAERLGTHAVRNVAALHPFGGREYDLPNIKAFHPYQQEGANMCAAATPS